MQQSWAKGYNALGSEDRHGVAYRTEDSRAIEED